MADPGLRDHEAREAVIRHPRAVVVVLAVHEKDGIEAPDFLQAAPGNEPGGCVHGRHAIAAGEIAAVRIGDEFRCLGREVVHEEVPIQKRAGVVEVHRARHAGVRMNTHEGKQRGDRVRFDLRILVQEEDELRAPAQRMRDADIVGFAEAQVRALLDDLDAGYRARDGHAVVARRIVDDDYADRMIAPAQALEAALDPGCPIVVHDDCKHFSHGCARLRR